MVQNFKIMEFKKITTLNDNCEENFTKKTNELLDLGWVILSTNIGFVNSESYGFCNVLQAILALPK